MNCKHCHKETDSMYCSRKCTYSFHNAKKYNQKGAGKIQCPYCGGYYKALLHHTWQKHSISAREYKEEYELPYKKSLITEELRERKSEAVTQEIIDENLIEGGKKTRFKRGEERTKENTYSRLKKQT